MRAPWTLPRGHRDAMCFGGGSQRVRSRRCCCKGAAPANAKPVLEADLDNARRGGTGATCVLWLKGAACRAASETANLGVEFR